MKPGCAFLLAFACTGAAAADDAALHRCRDLRDAAARLACYDAIPLSSAAPVGSGARQAPPAPQNAQQPAATFGFEGRPAAPYTVAQPIESIESTIDGTFSGWLPSGQLKLVNGQVWQIADGSQAAYNLNSPNVKITRGVSSSFFVAIEGVAQTPRVRRVR